MASLSEWVCCWCSRKGCFSSRVGRKKNLEKMGS